MLMSTRFWRVALFFLACLMSALAVPPRGVAQVRCYGPYKFQTCENLGSGERTTVIHNGHDNVVSGYETATGHVFQAFGVRLGKMTYSDSINLHGRTGVDIVESYVPGRYHIEGRNFDKKRYSYECSILVGCY